MAFKDKKDFHDYGFVACCKYHKWFQDIMRLKASPEAQEIYFEDGFVIGDVSTLGMEYMMTKGEENDYTRWANNRIRKGLHLD